MIKWGALIFLVALTSCSPYQETFDCPMGRGEQCASLSTVNALADLGKYSKKPVVKTTTAYVIYPGTTKRMEL